MEDRRKVEERLGMERKKVRTNERTKHDRNKGGQRKEKGGTTLRIPVVHGIEEGMNGGRKKETEK